MNPEMMMQGMPPGMPMDAMGGSMSPLMMGLGGPPQPPPNLVHMIAQGGPMANQILSVLMQALESSQAMPQQGGSMNPMLMALAGGGGMGMPGAGY